MGVAHIQNPSKIICPFLDYCYTNMIADDLQDRLIWNEIDKIYVCWKLHGNEEARTTNSSRYTSDISKGFR